MRTRSVIIAAVTLFCTILIAVTGNTMLLTPKIIGIGDEMLNQSSELRATFDDFVACAKQPMCIRPDKNHKISDRVKAIELRRNFFAQQIWPNVLPKLLQFNDWASDSVSQSNLTFLKRTIARAGGIQAFKERCLPQLEYSIMCWSTGEMFFAPVVSFICHDTPPGSDRG